MIKTYSCSICHKTLDDKPIILVKELYSAGKYNQYYPVEHYDLCIKCYKAFDNWINKHRKEDHNESK